MYRKQILHGIDFLVSVQNPDGGIPGMKMTGTSACWTTAEALEAVLLSPYIQLSYHNFVYKMIEFLLSTQISSGEASGAWPEYISTKNAQTLTTGHALSALNLAKDVIVDDRELLTKIDQSIKLGFQYLDRKQNHDGGWGIQPDDDKKESRAFSTIFVLRGYIQNGRNYNNTKAVREACGYLMTLKDEKSGGFKQDKDSAPDACYTARIVSVLLRSGCYTRKDLIIKNALKFIFQDKSLKSLFAIKNESYITDSSAGMVIFHSNTPIDVMEALCLCDVYDRRVRKLGQWITDTQEDNGGWYLGGSRDPNINQGVITWTTNEGIYALSCCTKAFSERYMNSLKRRSGFYLKGCIFLFAILLILIFNPGVMSNNILITKFWEPLSNEWKSFLTFTVFSTACINLFSSFIYDAIKKLRKGGGG